jgi:hypothetical protein
VGALVIAVCNENIAVAEDTKVAEEQKEKTQTQSTSSIISDALTIIRNNPKITILGAVQSLFEAAMYIFVFAWPPTMNEMIQNSFGKSATTHYGTAFSYFMTSCTSMSGSTTRLYLGL